MTRRKRIGEILTGAAYVLAGLLIAVVLIGGIPLIYYHHEQQAQQEQQKDQAWDDWADRVHRGEQIAQRAEDDKAQRDRELDERYEADCRREPERYC